MAFLDIDLERLLNEGDWVQSQLDSGPAIQRRVSLNPIQMGMFNVLDITKFPNGNIWLDFLSDKYAPSEDAMEFMAYCFSKWGNDSKGKGAPCNDDVVALRNGTFGRYWDNVKMLQIKRPEHLYLTIALRVIIENKDMSNFINNLAKGFVRSAVNQVGRDGGRVISNSIYDNKNYVPIANANQQHVLQDNQEMPDNAVILNKPLTTGKIILFVFLSIFLFPLGSIGVAIYGLTKYFDKNAVMEWVESVPQYTTDRRYKTNSRYIGHANVKHKETILASPEVLAINKKNGIIAMSIGLSCAVIIGLSIIFT